MADITIAGLVGKTALATDELEVQATAGGASNKVTAASLGLLATPAIGAVTGLGTGVATALAVNVGSTGAPVVNGGALGTPSSGTLTNTTGLPVATGISGLGTGVATALAVNVGSAGAPVVNGGALGTPGSGTLTNATGLPIATGISGLGTGVATALAVNVGTAGAPVVNGGALGTPSSGTLTSATGLPIATGVSGLGTGVATALAVNVGSAGAPVVNGGALGTPSGGTATNITGLPISTGVSGLGTNVATFLATPSSANLAAALTDETGSGAAVFANTPTLVTPTLGVATATSVAATTFSGGAYQVTAAPADLGYSGITVAMTYGESLVPGDIVYIKSDGAVWKADANAAGLYPAVGLALETASSGSHLVLLHGIYRDDTRFNWTVGGTLYLSATAGSATQTQPSATDDVIQVLGFATHADRIYFAPSRDIMTHV